MGVSVRTKFLIDATYYPKHWRNKLEQERVPVLKSNRDKCRVAYDRKGTVPHANKQHSNKVVEGTHQMECNPHGAMIWSIIFIALSLVLRTGPKVFK